MRKANELMVQYAAYHRDKRNIVTHFIGIPMIVFSIGVLLARPAFEVGGIVLTPVWVIWALATAWYLTLGNLALGVAVGDRTRQLQREPHLLQCAAHAHQRREHLGALGAGCGVLAFLELCHLVGTTCPGKEM